MPDICPNCLENEVNEGDYCDICQYEFKAHDMGNLRYYLDDLD